MESLETDDNETVEEHPVNIITFEDYDDEVEAEADTEPTDDSQQNNDTLVLVSKGKYYKQTYRRAWESMPDFKGTITL